MTKRGEHYINKKEMNEEWTKSFEQGFATERLKELFWILSNRVCRSYKIMKKYKHPDDVEDFINEGFLQCVDNFKKFNPAKCTNGMNTFAYFTSCILNSNITFSKELYQKKFNSQFLKLDVIDW